MRAIGVITALAAVLASATTAAAQQTELDVGARVRVFAPTLSRRGVVGMVTGSGDTLALVLARARMRVAASDVTRLELSRGRSRWAGARVGVLWGAAIGAGLGLLTSEDARIQMGMCEFRSQCEGSPSVGERLSYVGTMALGGAAWGAMVGAIVGREQWDVVPPGGLALRPEVRGGRARLTMRYALR